ncbi:hypothetical protein ACFQXB_11620 [Plastorhodobacter daqingensis]|uniref:Uncharacterized protein n=1 Tax=Plastorhodobacter daqingensis TaxID=1387281 RepID=A0ABW2UJF7_9RHOB
MTFYRFIETYDWQTDAELDFYFHHVRGGRWPRWFETFEQVVDHIEECDFRVAAMTNVAQSLWDKYKVSEILDHCSGGLTSA